MISDSRNRDTITLCVRASGQASSQPLKVKPRWVRAEASVRSKASQEAGGAPGGMCLESPGVSSQGLFKMLCWHRKRLLRFEGSPSLAPLPS